jgi:hypothetical protein
MKERKDRRERQNTKPNRKDDRHPDWIRALLNEPDFEHIKKREEQKKHGKKRSKKKDHVKPYIRRFIENKRRQSASGE